MSKREAREQRQAAKFQKFEESKAAILSKVTQSDVPRVHEAPAKSSGPRVAPHLERAANASLLTPKISQTSNSRYNALVTWCVNHSDRTGQWTWGQLRDWGQKEWDEEINPKFSKFATMFWRDIDAATSESGHKMHHSHSIGDVLPEAQDRWKELELEQFDTLFRFRLGGVKRAWGFVIQAHFYMVWWDRTHSIYPVD